MIEYDYIIVGAGSAGCTLAYRLGADTDLKILVIEAGGQDKSPIIKVPLTWGLILKHRLYDWGYFTQPEPGMNNRRIECARGRVIGGSSTINGMAYARGTAQDYDSWAAELGLNGWSFKDVLPYFKRSESWQGEQTELRGVGGPLNVIRMDYRDPLLDSFSESVRALGYPCTADYNGRDAEGFGPLQTTIRNGKRWNAASAYLRPALKRGNVTVRTKAHVSKVLLDGNRATGVELVGKEQLFAKREVLLCGGVINSPQLLMLSGIGPGAHLAEHGIKVKVDLPGVGQNLQDHIVCDVRWRRKSPGPLHRVLRLDRLAVDLVKTWFFGTGLSAKVPAASCGLTRSEPGKSSPDLLLMLAAAPMTAGPHFSPFLKPYVDAFAMKGVFLTPESRGTVTLSSNDSRDAPEIKQNFLATEHDRRAVRNMIQRMREIGSHSALDSFRAEELAPGPDVTSNDDIDQFLKNIAITLHHPVGTCKMGIAEDPMAVLDEQLRVRGVTGLRVIDGSSIPKIVRGPTNAPIIMMAEKVSDLILGRTPL